MGRRVSIGGHARVPEPLVVKHAPVEPVSYNFLETTSQGSQSEAPQTIPSSVLNNKDLCFKCK